MLLKYTLFGVDVYTSTRQPFTTILCEDTYRCNFVNYVARSIMGFTGGMYLPYFVHVLCDSAKFFYDWRNSVVFILTLGLSFSHIVRVVASLLLPQFSKNGQQALTAYAFVLALTGPAKNTIQHRNNV
jgi:hypothetical protein